MLSKLNCVADAKYRTPSSTVFHLSDFVILRTRYARINKLPEIQSGRTLGGGHPGQGTMGPPYPMGPSPRGPRSGLILLRKTAAPPSYIDNIISVLILSSSYLLLYHSGIYYIIYILQVRSGFGLFWGRLPSDRLASLGLLPSSCYSSANKSRSVRKYRLLMVESRLPYDYPPGPPCRIYILYILSSSQRRLRRPPSSGKIYKYIYSVVVRVG